MNCTTISLARTATNGCGALNGVGVYLAAATTTATTKATINGLNVKSNNTSSNNNNNNNSSGSGSGSGSKFIHTMINAQTAANNNNNNTATTTTTTTMPTSTTATTTTMPNDSQQQQFIKKTDMAAKIIQQSDIICFDVDSTVIREEGIDELAEFCGKGSEVARVTKEAMGGAMTFQDALTIRLNIIRPTQQQIADFIKQRPSTLTRNVKRFIEQLRANGKEVYLISGGFDCLIAPVAYELGIPLTNLYANKLMFYFNGDYASFDTTQPTSKSGGKAEAISLIKQKYNSQALITMIGDGATDLEAVPPANNFIGFGGNVVRNEVFKRAQYYITDFEQLM